MLGRRVLYAFLTDASLTESSPGDRRGEGRLDGLRTERLPPVE